MKLCCSRTMPWTPWRRSSQTCAPPPTRTAPAALKQRTPAARRSPTAARNPPAAAKPSAAAAATEQRRLEGSTLDESVCTTLMRDFRHIGKKLAVVVMPFRSQATTLDLLRDWDLWGPLFVCLGLAVALCAGVDDSQRSSIFSIIFVVIWVGSAIVTINAQLLGGKISFLQSVCVLGYSVFPILVARLICMILEAFLPRIYLVRCAVVFPAMAWATKASKLFIGEVIVETRRSLAIFPVVGFYAWLGWMVVVV
mmetsp:Transcript_28454/g.95825  ORF Transcript_28454/g.95825 Transcript_28454/m.95825 type:complete len:253 (-) Transcript_28454:67-825(-)